MNFPQSRHARETLRRGKRISLLAEPGTAMLGVSERAPTGEAGRHEL